MRLITIVLLITCYGVTGDDDDVGDDYMDNTYAEYATDCVLVYEDDDDAAVGDDYNYDDDDDGGDADDDDVAADYYDDGGDNYDNGDVDGDIH